MARQLFSLKVSDLPSQQEMQRHPRYLYVIWEAGSDHYKLGIASHPTRRLSALQSGNRRKLSIVAVYHGSSVDCAYFEKAALRYFRAAPGSEWVHANSLDEIVSYLDSFCGDEK